jgi:uncharacterized protein (TIGR03435 family)
MFIRQAYYSRGTLPAHSPLEKAPDWIASARFQIIATAEGNPSIEMMRGPMLRAVLEDRFKLKVHRETREIPIYVLTVGPRGPKLYPWVESADCVNSLPSEWPAPPRKPGCGIRPRTGPNAIPTPAVWSGQRGSNRYFDLFPATLEEFAWNIGAFLDRPVVDKTGIAGFFDLHIEFSPDGTILPPSLPDDPPSAPSFFTAIQEQLGLKLEPSRGPYDFFVIDSIDRLVEN